jgi:hypothetical protein
MKSKITEIEYADGRLEYVAEYKRSIIEEFRYNTHNDAKIAVVVLFVLFLPFVLPIALTNWNKSIFKKLDDAKDYIHNAELKLEKRKAEYFNDKQSKKKVRTKTISEK